jgi:hypothetical protein
MSTTKSNTTPKISIMFDYIFNSEELIEDNILNLESDNLPLFKIRKYINMKPQNKSHEAALRRYESTLNLVRMRNGQKTYLYQLNKVKEHLRNDLINLCVECEL